MASTSALTGGTKDVNPQVMSATLRSGTNTNESYTVEVPLPVQRLNNRNRSMVMEILGWQIYSNNTGNHHVRVGFATQKPAASVVPLLADPSIVVMQVIKGTAFDLTPTFNYVTHDGAGHGILVAADKIYFFCNSPSTSAHDYELRITYRWKNVSLTEYIGIVQSSQA